MLKLKSCDHLWKHKSPISEIIMKLIKENLAKPRNSYLEFGKLEIGDADRLETGL